MLLTEIGRRRVRTDAVRFDGHPPHSHDHPQLVHIVVGEGTVIVAGERMTIAEGQSIWLPSRVEHALELLPGSVVMGPMLTGAGEPPSSRPRFVDEPAIHRMMVTTMSIGPSDPEELRLVRDEIVGTLRAVADEYFALRMPMHPAARAIAEQLSSSAGTLHELAEQQYMSERQIQRLFLEQTGLPFTTWRTRARLNAAIGRLRAGHGVDAALGASGFSTRAGLLKALSRECGVPREHLLADPVGALSGSPEHAA